MQMLPETLGQKLPNIYPQPPRNWTQSARNWFKATQHLPATSRKSDWIFLPETNTSRLNICLQSPLGTEPSFAPKLTSGYTTFSETESSTWSCFFCVTRPLSQDLQAYVVCVVVRLVYRVVSWEALAGMEIPGCWLGGGGGEGVGTNTMLSPPRCFWMCVAICCFGRLTEKPVVLEFDFQGGLACALKQCSDTCCRVVRVKSSNVVFVALIGLLLCFCIYVTVR